MATPIMPGMATSRPRKSSLSPGIKRNARYRVLETRPVNASLGLVSDETILLTGTKARECPKPLRRSIYQDPATGKVNLFLSNHLRLAAKTFANIYKERWQVDIFFGCIKQNLKVKAFIGNSENAVMSQIYVALIVYLLLCHTRFLCNLSVTLQIFIRILQLNLFRTCPVQELFEPPGLFPDNMNVNKQLYLALG